MAEAEEHQEVAVAAEAAAVAAAEAGGSHEKIQIIHRKIFKGEQDGSFVNEP